MKELLNVKTLAIVLAMLSLYSAFAFLLLYIWHKSEKYLKLALFSFALIAAGMILFLTRFTLPYWASIIVPNVFVISGQVLYLMSVRQLFYRRIYPWSIVGTTITAIILFYFYTIVDFSTAARMIMFSVATFVIFVLVALEFYRGQKVSSGAVLPGVFLYSMVSLFHVLRITGIFSSTTPDEIFISPAWNAGIFAVSSVNLLFAPLLFSLVINQRLQNYEKNIAKTDYLTGIWNRRGFEHALTAEQSRCSRTGSMYSYIAIDLDHFKNINDFHGHQAGDIVLSSFARLLLKIIRTEDIVARVGGEEFAVILPGVPLAEAEVVAGRILAEARKSPVMDDGKMITYTASAGVAASDETGADEIIQTADRRLYEAKHRGRDCYVAIG